jgi:hypothetical protein
MGPTLQTTVLHTRPLRLEKDHWDTAPQAGLVLWQSNYLLAPLSLSILNDTE